MQAIDSHFGHGRVEERCDHRQQQVDLIDHGHVGRAGQDRQAVPGQAGEVADDAAAEQAEELGDVLGRNDVGVPDDEQAWVR